jgi:acetolactate decarboxylase
LSQGIYEGDTSFDELKKHGNFGIGTFNDLDGEMVALNGQFYQVKADGHVYLVEAGWLQTPFSVVTFFDPETALSIDREMPYETIIKFLGDHQGSKNIFYAIKIHGDFRYIKVRSVPPQKKPYPALAEAIKNQKIFEYRDIRGTIIGFWCPAYAENVNVAGYHFHFISDDKEKGGHLLDAVMSNGVAEISQMKQWVVTLPGTKDFLKTNISQSTYQAAEQ